jgi:hypothetical protein
MSRPVGSDMLREFGPILLVAGDLSVDVAAVFSVTLAGFRRDGKP